jgi:hypothetical protein
VLRASRGPRHHGRALGRTWDKLRQVCLKSRRRRRRSWRRRPNAAYGPRCSSRSKGRTISSNAVRAGKIAVSLAAKLATASEAIQRKAIAKPERAHVLVKQVKRFEPRSRETCMDRAADNHYSTPLERLKALDVASIAASHRNKASQPLASSALSSPVFVFVPCGPLSSM